MKPVDVGTAIISENLVKHKSIGDTKNSCKERHKKAVKFVQRASLIDK